MFIIKLLTSLLTGGLDKALSTYRDLQIAKLQLDGDTNKIVRDLELERLENIRQAQSQATEIRIATKDHIEVRVTVGLIGFAAAFHFATTVLDSVYHFGWNIAKLPSPMDEWQQYIILSYFGYGAVKAGMNVAAAALLRRNR